MPASCLIPAYGASKVGNCVRGDITPKHFSTHIIIIANIIFELETSTIFVGIRKEAPIGTISVDPGNNSDPRNMIWLLELLANQQVAICSNKTGNGKKARAYKRRPEGPQLRPLIPHINNIETSYNYFSQSERSVTITNTRIKPNPTLAAG